VFKKCNPKMKHPKKNSKNMLKTFISICFSTFCALLSAQSLPWLLPPSRDFKDVTPFSEGLSVVKKVVNKEERFYFLDNQMHLSADSYLDARPVSHGFACVYEKSNTGYWWRFRKGEYKRFGEYEKIADFQNDLAAVQKQGKWGFINTNGEEKIDCQYDGVRSFENSTAGVLKKGNVLIINSLGMPKKIPYQQIHEFSEGLAAVWNQDGDIGYIDSTGRTVIPVQKGRKYAGNFYGEYAAVCDTLPHLAFINKAGKKVFWFKNGTTKDLNHGVDLTDENMYRLHPFANGLAAVRQLGKWGFVDMNGKVIIPCAYDAVTRFSEGFAAVKQAGKWFYINTLGDIVRIGDFIDAKPCSEGMAWVKTMEGWGILAVTEKLSIVLASPFKNGVTKDKISLHATVVSHAPLQWAEWDLNGQKIQTKFALGTLNASLNQNIVLKTGRNVLKLTAKSTKSVQTNESIIYYQPSQNAPIRYYGVMVANDSYQSEHWVSLEGTPEHPSSPIRDADALAAILLGQYQFESVFILQNATLDQMNAVLEELTQHEDAEERVLFFYAGHGDFDPVRKRAYLVPIDAHGSERKSQLAANHFSNQVNFMPSNHILTIIDACFGGSFVLDDNLGNIRVEKPAPKTTPAKEVKATSNQQSAWRGGGVGKKRPIDTLAKPMPSTALASQRPSPDDLETSESLKAREVMSSGQRVEVPNASDFIQTLLEQLRSNKDTKLAARTLFERIKAPVMQKGLVPQHGVLPNAGSDGGDFIFRKKK
jgi:WG containing repeat/Caspase domain